MLSGLCADVVSLVVKAGDDIRQEELAMQLLRQFNRIFQSAKLPMWLCPYVSVPPFPLGQLISFVGPR